MRRIGRRGTVQAFFGEFGVDEGVELRCFKFQVSKFV
jgi:hypothetical protein